MDQKRIDEMINELNSLPVCSISVITKNGRPDPLFGFFPNEEEHNAAVKRCAEYIAKILEPDEKILISWSGLLNYYTEENFAEDFSIAAFVLTENYLYTACELDAQVLISKSKISDCRFYDICPFELGGWDSAALGFMRTVYFIYNKCDEFTNALKKALESLGIRSLNTSLFNNKVKAAD